VPWSHVPEAVQGLDWRGQIVIDATNDFDPSDLNGGTSSELVAELVAPAPVVKTATHSPRRFSPLILMRPVVSE
jgi:predicted dinucleotide-binding enzyme